MSIDLEPAGALVTAGLAAHEIDGGTASNASHAAGHSSCRNCGSTLHGAWCSACGQSAHIHRSLLHLSEELAHGILHFDAKGWRTLPLLIGRPGLLTRRYIDGQRMRYVSPLALFLFTVFLMFFVVSLTSSSPHIGDSPEARADLQHDLDEADATLKKAEAKLAQVQADGKSTDDANDDVVDARLDATVAKAALGAFDQATSQVAEKEGAGATPGDGAHEIDPKNRWLHLADKVDFGDRHPKLAATLKHALSNPELTLYKLKNTAYKYSFLLVPISLPFMWLMFAFRRDVTAYDHAVFVLYSLSFMSLLIVGCALLSYIPGISALVLLAFFVPPVHMAAQLRETYRLGWFGTLWRTGMLVFVSSFVFMIYVILIVLLTMG